MVPCSHGKTGSAPDGHRRSREGRLRQGGSEAKGRLMETRGQFESPKGGLTRREFIVAGTAAMALTALPNVGAAQTAASTRLSQSTLMKVAFTVNGKLRELEL